MMKLIDERKKIEAKIIKGKSRICIEELQTYPTNIYLTYRKDEFSNYEEFKHAPLLSTFSKI